MEDVTDTAPMIAIAERDVEWTAIRAQGAGGQNVNKVSSAIHLRFDIRASSLPSDVKAKLLERRDQRITADGVIVLKAQRYRTQERNRDDAMVRLQAIVDAAAAPSIPRKPTRPTKGSQQRRVDGKVRRGLIKSGRGRIVGE